VSNTRIFGNHGTLTGGINVGNGETPPLYVNDGTLCGPGIAAPAPLCPPLTGVLPNAAIPFQLNTRVHVHHNACLTTRASADALFSGTPSGAGGVTISAGADNYRLDHNWVAGNFEHRRRRRCRATSGLSFNGTIDHKLHPVSTRAPTRRCRPNGGGLGIIGANVTRTLPNGNECNSAEVPTARQGSVTARVRTS